PGAAKEKTRHGTTSKHEKNKENKIHKDEYKIHKTTPQRQQTNRIFIEKSQSRCRAPLTATTRHHANTVAIKSTRHYKTLLTTGKKGHIGPWPSLAESETPTSESPSLKPEENRYKCKVK